MDKIKAFLSDKKNIVRMIVLIAIAVIIELVVFNISSIKSMGLNPILIDSEAVTDDDGDYRSETITVDGPVKNIMLSDVLLFNCECVDVSVTITDEGDEYEYDMPSFRVVQGVPSTGFTNIYPYGDVHTLSVHVTAPEGAAASIGSITINNRRPVDIKPIRLLIIILILFTFNVLWYDGWFTAFTFSCDKKNKAQLICTILVILFLIFLGKKLSTINERIVSCPWPHHKQYQELAVALDNGTVVLDKEVDPKLLEKENPYDTIALYAEDIYFHMDYAYYDGNYYVYFGIIPELLLYYPYYKLKGVPLNNYDAQFAFYIILVIGVFLTIWQLVHRYGKKDDKCNVPYILYLLLSVGITLFSNHIYLISRADIYNIPVMSASACTWMGIGCLLTAICQEKKACRLSFTFAGALCMALVAGCRPQFILYSVIALVLLAPGYIKDIKGKIADIICFIVPYILVAIVVCWYNQARFGSILEFGATFSLTTNDMNHRGFNLDRLLRGLYAFFFQPAVTTFDFPYLKSSVVASNYMGKNLTEFTYGGCFATNVLLLSVFAPLFGMWKKLSNEVKWLFTTMLGASAVIAVFDVNGAGILYRYTCDFIPGVLIAAIIIWIVMLTSDGHAYRNVCRLLTICLFIGLFYSLLVLLGTGDSVNLMDNSKITYEHIREYFRV